MEYGYLVRAEKVHVRIVVHGGDTARAVVSLLYDWQTAECMTRIINELIVTKLVHPKVYVTESSEPSAGFVCFAKQIPYMLARSIEPAFYLEAATPDKTVVTVQHFAQGLFSPEAIAWFLAHAHRGRRFYMQFMARTSTGVRPFVRLQGGAENIHIGLPPEGFLCL